MTSVAGDPAGELHEWGSGPAAPGGPARTPCTPRGPRECWWADNRGADRSGHRERRSRGGDMLWSLSPGLGSRPGSRAEVPVWCEGTADPDLPVLCPGTDSALGICSTFFHFYFPSYPCRSRCRGRAGTWRWDLDAGGCWPAAWLRVGGPLTTLVLRWAPRMSPCFLPSFPDGQVKAQGTSEQDPFLPGTLLQAPTCAPLPMADLWGSGQPQTRSGVTGKAQGQTQQPHGHRRGSPTA